MFDMYSLTAYNLPKVEGFLSEDEVNDVVGTLDAFAGNPENIARVRKYTSDVYTYLDSQGFRVKDGVTRKKLLQQSYEIFGSPSIYIHDSKTVSLGNPNPIFIHLLDVDYFKSMHPKFAEYYDRFVDYVRSYIDPAKVAEAENFVSYSIIYLTGQTEITVHTDFAHAFQIILPVSNNTDAESCVYDAMTPENLPEPHACALDQFQPMVYNVTKMHDAHIRQENSVVAFRAAINWEAAHLFNLPDQPPLQ